MEMYLWILDVQYWEAAKLCIWVFKAGLLEVICGTHKFIQWDSIEEYLDFEMEERAFM